MIIEDFALVLRRRQPWEALDLGLVIARRWRKSAFLAWLATYGVTALAACLLLLWDARLAWFLIWWLKPLFDRVLLHVYSRAVFGSEPGLRETLLATRGFLASRQLWADLTIRRLTLIRSFSLPVTVLERQSGALRTNRINTLLRSTKGCATWLTFCCGNFVLLAMATIVAAEGLLTPGSGSIGVWLSRLTVEQGNRSASLAALVLFMVCESLVEPIYVASGFTLYLNRRSELEGWDLELAFRRLDRRLKKAAPVVLQTLLVALCIGLLWLPAKTVCAKTGAVDGAAAGAGPDALPPAHAAEMPPARVPLGAAGTADLERVPERIKQVLKDPVFGHDVVESSWRLRNPPEPRNTSHAAWLQGLLAMLDRIAQTLALLLGWGVRLLLAIVLVVATVVLVRWNWQRRSRADDKVGKNPLPVQMSGLNVSQESLPEDVGGAALSLVEKGLPVEALALLYRASLSTLIHRIKIPLSAGDTEGRCLARATGRIGAQNLAYFERLIAAWQLAAYAHVPPRDATIGELCAGWAAHFGPDMAIEAPGA